MSAQSASSTSSIADVWLNSAEVRAWLELSHEELDDLVASGAIQSTPSRLNLKPIFKASDVSKLAAERSQAVPA